MNKIWLIIKREYLTRVKKKSFIVMTFIGPLLFAGLIVGGVLLSASDTSHHRVLIADDKGWVIEEEVEKYLVAQMPRPRFKNDEKVSYDFRKGLVDAAAEIKSGAYTAVLQIDSLTYEDGKCILTYDKVPSMSVQERIRAELEASLEQWRVRKLAINYEDYKRIKKPVVFENRDANTGLQDMTSIRAVIGFAFALVIYLFIFLYGVQVMRGVIEEKTNRIIEVIVSSVRPFQLMMGKVVGIGLVGLTQFLMWVVLTLLITTVGISLYTAHQDEQMKKSLLESGLVQGNMPVNEGLKVARMDGGNVALQIIQSIPWADVLFSFVFFFVGGYLLYGSLFAAVGAAVDQETDTQQFMMPITLPLVFAYIVSVMMIENPESSMGTIFSIVPLTSPVVMMVKTCIGVPIGLKLLSMLSLVVSFVAFIWIAGRIYRVGILMYGKKASYRELWKWIRYSNR